MIEEIIDTMVDVTMEFEELEPKECIGVFVSGRHTFEIWKGEKLIHFRIFHYPYFAEFTFPEKELGKIVSKLKGEDKMQMLKLKRIRKKKDMPLRKTVETMGFRLNEQWIDISKELDGRVIITNNSNGKIYELINQIDNKYNKLKGEGKC